MVPLAAGTADLTTRTVRLRRRSAVLTERECEVLAYLAARPGRTVPRDELLVRVFGYRRASPSRVVDTAVARLRSKIEDDPQRPSTVVSVFGEGYRYVSPSRRSRPSTERRGIPAERGPLVGRGDDLERLRTLVAAHRAVVVSGPAGVGKTRLVARLAAELDAERVWFVSVAHATTPAELAFAVAQVAGLPSDGPTARVAAVVAQELDRRHSTVLILDNLEQLPDAGRWIGRWIGATATLRIVGTSRAPVGIAGEVEVRLGCLAPADAQALYVDRAEAAGATIAPAHLPG
ncbi:MAG: winged helix-turn-helix domain-containing protein, partial [Myxococcota bacterium]